jgi:hypothetical protein
LLEDASKSAVSRKIDGGYHWIELQLSDEKKTIRESSLTQGEPFDPLSLRALRFSHTTVEVHRRLSETGRANLGAAMSTITEMNIPEAYRSLIFIVVAEVARRRCEDVAMRQAISSAQMNY